MTNKTNTVEEQIKKILNTGRSGDLDHFGCAEYNPELVGKLASLFNQYADSKFKRALPEKKDYVAEMKNMSRQEVDSFNDAIEEIKSRWEEESK